MRRFPQSLSSRLLFALTIISLISVLSLGLAAYFSQRNVLLIATRTELDTIAQLKVEQLISWLNERKADLSLLANDRSIQEYLREVLKAELDESERDRYLSLLQNELINLNNIRPDYKRIEILDADGRVFLSTDPSRVRSASETGPFLLNTLTSPGGAYLQEISRNPDTGELEMLMGRAIPSPAAATSSDESNIGVVVINVSLASSLFRHLNHWPDSGQSTEIVLGREDGDALLVLNPLRLFPDSALSLRIPLERPNREPVALAVDGDFGTTISRDYRAIPVVAAFRRVPNTDWAIVAKIDQAEAFAPVNSLARRLAFLSLVAFFLAWIAAFILWRRIATPLEKLVSATQAVIDGKYAPIELEDIYDDEIGILARSFQDMLSNLERRQRELSMANRVVADTAMTNTRLVSELRKLNAGLEAKVTERTKELSEANKKLTHLDQLKSKFISNVSHELRNPIASLKLYLRLLEKSNDSNRERYIAGISSQIDWLGKLIENVLDLTQLERGNMPLDMEHIDMRDVVERALKVYRPLAEQANVELIGKIAAHPVLVHGSDSKLMQIVTNLLANAINYTYEGAITVELRSSNTDAILCVEDTGIGIEAEDIPHLFERFYRGKNTQELEIRGTGLGLGIVDEIVELHAGHIEVESQVGIGSRFLVFLPLSNSAAEKMGSTNEAQHRRQLKQNPSSIKLWSKGAK